MAYVVSKEDSAVSAGDLRSFLKEKLPEYMVPSYFVFLTELPLTANGKVDKKRLPAPKEGPGEREYEAPRTPTEELLAEIWADALNVPRVGIHDNFFALGGHSLLAMQVISRVRKVFRTELPLRWLFEAKDIESLCVMLMSDEDRAAQVDKIAIIVKQVFPQGGFR
jgi:hypothetical protein